MNAMQEDYGHRVETVAFKARRLGECALPILLLDCLPGAAEQVPVKSTFATKIEHYNSAAQDAQVVDSQSIVSALHELRKFGNRSAHANHASGSVQPQEKPLMISNVMVVARACGVILRRIYPHEWTQESVLPTVDAVLDAPAFAHVWQVDLSPHGDGNDADAVWTDYEPSTSALIEAQWMLSISSYTSDLFDVNSAGRVYAIDFIAMEQQMTTDGTITSQRSIRRRRPTARAVADHIPKVTGDLVVSRYDKVVHLIKLPPGSSKKKAAAAAAGLDGFTNSNVVKQKGWWNFSTPAQAEAALPHLLAAFPGSQTKGSGTILPAVVAVTPPVSADGRLNIGDIVTWSELNEFNFTVQRTGEVTGFHSQSIAPGYVPTTVDVLLDYPAGETVVVIAHLLALAPSIPLLDPRSLPSWSESGGNKVGTDVLRRDIAVDHVCEVRMQQRTQSALTGQHELKTVTKTIGHADCIACYTREAPPAVGEKVQVLWSDAEETIYTGTVLSVARNPGLKSVDFRAVKIRYDDGDENRVPANYVLKGFQAGDGGGDAAGAAAHAASLTVGSTVMLKPLTMSASEKRGTRQRWRTATVVAVHTNHLSPPMSPTTSAVATSAAPRSFKSAALYVGDLHPEVTEATLFEIFNAVAPVASVRVCRHAVTRRSLGYAYVNFHSTDAADKVLESMNYTIIKGRMCRLMWSQRDPTLRKSGSGNVFIKNLHEDIDSKDLADTFSIFGAIISCKVVVDYQTGKSRGYGFVHFETKEAADEAIAKVNGNMISEKQVFVGHFQRPDERSATKLWTNLYVKNLPVEWDDAKLKEFFESCGAVASALVMVDDAGVSKGFGFVDYEEHESAVKCVDTLHKTEVEGTILSAHKAKAAKAAKAAASADGAAATAEPTKVAAAKAAEPTKSEPAERTTIEFAEDGTPIEKVVTRPVPEGMCRLFIDRKSVV
jgi:RNA recognition motif-containing protein